MTTATLARVRAEDLLELTKPRVTSLVTLTTAAGFALAFEGPFDAGRFWATVAGTALVAGGSAALNQVAERDVDARMRRTANRPLPAGRTSVEIALAWGFLLAATGTAILAAGVNALTALIGAATLVLYVFVYTPLKRVSSLATIVGALPGAAPPLMGWTAAVDRIDAGGWILFALLFLWQLPHFLAIAWLYRDDYRRAGFPLLTVNDPDGARTARQALLWAATVIPVSLLPVALGIAGRGYFAAALVLGVAFLAVASAFVRAQTPTTARRLLLASVTYLPLVLGAMVVDHQLGRAAAFAEENRLMLVSESAPPVLAEIPDFSLVDAAGKPFTRAALLGRPWIVDFIFTRCQGSCPLLTEKMKKLAADLGRSRVGFLSISVDPDFDTPKILAAYAREKDAVAAAWTFATGDRDAVYRLIQHGFLLPVERDAPGDGGLVLHSDRFALLDARARLRGTYEMLPAASGNPSERGQGLPELKADLAALAGDPD